MFITLPQKICEYLFFEVLADNIRRPKMYQSFLVRKILKIYTKTSKSKILQAKLYCNECPLFTTPFLSNFLEL